MTYGKIAQILGISRGGAQLIERRALAKLALALGIAPGEVVWCLRDHMRVQHRKVRASKRG